MIKFSNFSISNALSESSGDKSTTRSGWTKVKPKVKELMEEELQDFQHRLQELNLEVGDSVMRYDFGKTTLGFGVGCYFKYADQEYLVFDNYSEGMFRLYKVIGQEKTYMSNLELMTNSVYLEYIFKDLKQMLQEGEFLTVDITPEEGQDRMIKIKLDSEYKALTKKSLKKTANYLFSKIKQAMEDSDDMFTTVFYFDNEIFKMIGNSRDFGVMDSDDRDVDI